MGVLIADDSSFVRRSLQHALGADSRTVNSARELIRAAEDSQPSVILIDHHFGHGEPTAIDLLPEIHRAAPNAAVIVTTDEYQATEKEEAMEGGAFSYAEKEISLLKALVSVARHRVEPVFVSASSSRRH